MILRWLLLAAMAGVALAACTETKSPPGSALAPEGLITSADQLEAAVGKSVTLLGIQSRTKTPTVCGVDVEGDYALSDRKVIVRGVLRRHVVTEVDPMTANRGPGSFYSVEDPATGQLAKTAPHEE